MGATKGNKNRLGYRKYITPEQKELQKKNIRNCHINYNNKHKVEINNHNKENNQKRRMIVLQFYGGNPPKCACCGEKEIKFLSIDHIKGGGTKHRKEMGVGKSIYPWLIRNNFPEGFQVLCHNCNMAKGFYGICPHFVV